jgi:hypothetical protein
MLKRDLLVGCGAGAVAGLIIAVGFLSGPVLPRVAAQAAPGAPSRYVMRTWEYPGHAYSSGSNSGSFGAFILDTQNGKVWMSKDGGKLQELGEVK